MEILQAMKIDDDEPLVRIERGVCKVRLKKQANVFKIAAMQGLKCLFKRCEIFVTFLGAQKSNFLFLNIKSTMPVIT